MQNKNLKLFGHFITESSQRKEIFLLLILLTIIGIILYNLYPYPFTFGDSGAYFLGAAQNYFNIFRPMGYSRYLSAIHHINPSLSFIFWFTYYLNAFSSLLLLYSIKYFFEINNKIIFYLLCAFTFLSPTILFATNFIMSDSLFYSLTLLFIALCVWVLYEKKWYIIVLLLLTFIALYKVRYSGMFYIFIPIYAFYVAFSKANYKKRIAILLLPVLCFLFLYTQTKKEYYKETGFNISSGFSGWQLINNASVLLPEAKSLPLSEFKNPDVKTLHLFLQAMPDSLFKDKYALATSHMWDKNLAYKQFLFYCMQQTQQNYATAWLRTSTIYAEYSKKLISKYPVEYLTKFIIPSFMSTFKYYDITECSYSFVNEPMLQQYYNIDIDKYEHHDTVFAPLNPIRKIMHYLYWTALVLAICWFLFNIRKNKFSNSQWQIAFLLFIFIISYIGASSLASPNTTWRYAMPIYLPSIIFILYNAREFALKCKIDNKLLFQTKK